MPSHLKRLMVHALLCLVLPLAARATTSPDVLAVDPNTDPKDDPKNPLRYIPSNILTGVSVGLYVTSTSLLGMSMWRWGAKWMLVTLIGGLTMSVGLGLRFGLTLYPDSTPIYIAEYLLVVLSPCAFIAGDYVLLSHLATWLDAGQYLFISPRYLARTFVTSDIVTFLIQAIGGVMLTSTNMNTSQLGSHVFLAGLVIQLVSFLFYCLTYTRFLWLLRRHSPEVWHTAPWNSGWKLLALGLSISCVGIIIRSFYRVVEFSQTFPGVLATTEKYFYGFDTLPLYVAITVYVVIWPGRILSDAAREKLMVTSSISMTRLRDEEHALELQVRD